MQINLSTGEKKTIPAAGDAGLRMNAGEGFFHPVTHEFVPAGAFYSGAAHQPHENEAPAAEETAEDVKAPETTQGPEKPERPAETHQPAGRPDPAAPKRK